MIPYSRQSIDETDIAAVKAVLRSDFLTQGPANERFERDFARLHQTRHAIAMSNATVALHLGCLALGVGHGDRVWTSPISFVASANCALYCGAKVDFVDIDPRSRLMCVSALEEKLKIADQEGKLPRVVIPVDLTGMPCDYANIRRLADKYGFAVLADASHAVGAQYEGTPLGSRYVDAAVFSFHAVKVVTCGEGGLLATNNDALAERVRLLRSHGITRDPDAMERVSPGGYYYEQLILGFNARMTDMQAALGASQLARLPKMHASRVAAADRYDTLLAGSGWIRPQTYDDRVSAWHLYVVEREDNDQAERDRTFARLRADGIGANLHYLPITSQPYYEKLGFSSSDFPAAKLYGERALTIPLFPAIEDALIERTVHLLTQ